jgi:hypothetical protein
MAMEGRTHMKSRAFAVMVCGLVVGLILVLMSVGGARKPQYGGTLTVVHGVDISHLDFQTAPGYESMWIDENIHNGVADVCGGEFVLDRAFGIAAFKALGRHVKGFDYQGEVKFHVEKVWLEK